MNNVVLNMFTLSRLLLFFASTPAPSPTQRLCKRQGWNTNQQFKIYIEQDASTLCTALRGDNNKVYSPLLIVDPPRRQKESRKTEGQKVRKSESQKVRKSERQKDRKTERQKNRKTERQKDRKTERQKDRKTERQKDRKTERQKDRKIERLVPPSKECVVG